MPPRIIFSINKIKFLSWRVCKLISVYFKGHWYVKPGRLTQYRGLIPYSSKDTLTNFSITSANKTTSLLQYNLVSSSPFLISNTLIISLVRSISSSSRHLFIKLPKKSFFLDYQQAFDNHQYYWNIDIGNLIFCLYIAICQESLFSR